MFYIIIADIKYYEDGPSIQSYLNIQDEGVFWDDGSMDIWDDYQHAVNVAEVLRNDGLKLSRSYAEVENIRVSKIQIMTEEI